jgi:hypothetical protein
MRREGDKVSGGIPGQEHLRTDLSGNCLVTHSSWAEEFACVLEFPTAQDTKFIATTHVFLVCPATFRDTRASPIVAQA